MILIAMRIGKRSLTLIRPDFIILMYIYCIYLVLMRMKSAERSVFKTILSFFFLPKDL